MMEPPSASGSVIASPATGPLNRVDSNGSRYMMRALRKGPTRLIDTNSANTEIVVATLTAMRATQPVGVAGACQFQVSKAAAARIAVDDNIKYHVVSCGSESCS